MDRGSVDHVRRDAGRLVGVGACQDRGPGLVHVGDRLVREGEVEPLGGVEVGGPLHHGQRGRGGDVLLEHVGQQARRQFLVERRVGQDVDADLHPVLVGTGGRGMGDHQLPGTVRLVDRGPGDVGLQTTMSRALQDDLDVVAALVDALTHEPAGALGVVRHRLCGKVRDPGVGSVVGDQRGTRGEDRGAVSRRTNLLLELVRPHGHVQRGGDAVIEQLVQLPGVRDVHVGVDESGKEGPSGPVQGHLRGCRLAHSGGLDREDTGVVEDDIVETFQENFPVEDADGTDECFHEIFSWSSHAKAASLTSRSMVLPWVGYSRVRGYPLR